MENDKFYLLKKEVDSLQIQLAKSSGPWYSKPSNIFALLALLFSFGTTLVSAYSAHQQDIQDNRREARSLLLRLSKLPIENYDLMQKYKGSGPGEALSGMINQENILLATQAAELIERYPESFSATEYFSVAFALSSSNIVDKVPFLFERAIKKSMNSNDYNVSSRAYAGFLYVKGDYSEGKKYFDLALNVWDIFPERNLYIVNSVELVTLMYWAQAELGASNISEAEKTLDLARERLAQLAPGKYTNSLRNQIDATSNAIEQAYAAGPR